MTKVRRCPICGGIMILVEEGGYFKEYYWVCQRCGYTRSASYWEIEIRRPLIYREGKASSYPT